MFRLLIIFLAGLNIFASKLVLLNSDNIHIHYPEKRMELARFIARTVRNRLPEMEKIFGKTDTPIQIYVAETQSDFRKMAGVHLPDWSAAVTIYPKRIIVLKNPLLTQSSLHEFREIVEHEFVHLYQSLHIPLNITPVWFNEGFAQYISTPYNIQGRILLSRALVNNQLIPMSKLADVLGYRHQKAALAYAESASIVEFLIVVYGENIISEMFSDIQKTRDFEKSFRNILGIGLIDFEHQWKKYVARRYRWLFLLDIQYIIWLIIPLLVIVVYFIKGHRNKEIIQQWNTEEIAMKADIECKKPI